MLLRELIIPVFTFFISVAPTPSYNFRMIFPANASQTITSAYPVGISLASILPMKFISGQFFKSGNVSFTSAFPFSSSAPIFTIATFGFGTPMTLSMYTEPIFANCTRWDGLASTLAPQSIRSEQPVSVGISGARGGRSMPLILPTISCPPTSTAPELPADTNASQTPSFTGGSAVSIISSALTISICSLLYVYCTSSFLMTSCLPVRYTLILLFSVTASIAPFTISAGALSPPMASTATLVISPMFKSSIRNYLAALLPRLSKRATAILSTHYIHQDI